MLHDRSVRFIRRSCWLPPLRWLPLLLWVASTAQLATAGPVPPVAFRDLRSGVRGEAATAVAFDPATRRLAVGDGSGVLVGRAGEPLYRTLRRGPVRDLVFLPEAVAPARDLLVATPRGLFRVAASGHRLVVPGAGEAARNVTRLAVSERAVAAATAGGVFVSEDGSRWVPLTGPVPRGLASAVALREVGDVLECWSTLDGRLWRVRVRRGDAGLRAEAAARVSVPFAGGSGAPVEVRFDVPGAEVAVLSRSAVALQRAGGDWEVLRPNLPPGSSAVRFAVAVGRFWLGTTRGLLEAPTPQGPWHRAKAPAGSLAIQALAGAPRTLYAATDRGLFAGASPATRAASAAAPARAPRSWPRTPEPSPEPSVERVHLAALAYLELQPYRVAELRRGLARRGWLPELSVRLGSSSDHRRSVERDQAFLSGETRRLVDRDLDRIDEMELALELSWDLGDTAYHPDSIDVSREARALVELRDDVLDEITQFYFERQRVLLDLERIDDPSAPDAARLRLRAAELAAGIDAWTGGWFSRNAPPLPP